MPELNELRNRPVPDSTSLLMLVLAKVEKIKSNVFDSVSFVNRLVSKLLSVTSNKPELSEYENVSSAEFGNRVKIFSGELSLSRIGVVLLAL